MRIFLFALLLFSFAACGDDDEGTSTNCISTVDQAQVLTRYADLAENRASALVSEAVQLEGLAVSYLASPTIQGLDSMQAEFLEVAQAWLQTEPFAYGPNGSMLVKMELNAFPVDEAAVDALVSAGGFDASTPQNFDRGLPALDYLLFNGSVSDINQRLSADADARQVITDLSTAILGQANLLLSAWSDAQSTFPTLTGTSAGSSMSVLINYMSKHFEDTRRDRIGTPFGITTLGFPNPQTVEAPYSGKSLEWLRLAIEANRSAFLATDPTSTQSLPSIADYLRSLPTTDAASLVTDMESQYTIMLTELADIDGPLETAVEQDIEDVRETYNAISRQVVNLKTDVPAITCIAITYVDNPSDSD